MAYLIEFRNSLKPQDLLSFTPEYLDEVALLKETSLLHLQNGQPLILPTKRLDLKTGNFSTRYVHGIITNTSEDGLQMYVHYTSMQKEGNTGKTQVNNIMNFRYDSFLSELPVFHDDMVPCLLNQGKHAEYSFFLDEVTAFLRIQEGNGKKFNFVYHNTFAQEITEYYFHGAVRKVHTSNIEVRIDFSNGETKNGFYMNTVPRDVVRPYLTPQTMLIGIV